MKSDKKEITKMVEEIVDQGATSAEEIHRSVADLPITVLERLGFSQETTEEAKKIQDATIGSIYDLVRDINHNVTGMANEIIQKAATAKTEAEAEES